MRRSAIICVLGLVGISMAAGPASQPQPGEPLKIEKRQAEARLLVKGEGFFIHITRQKVQPISSQVITGGGDMNLPALPLVSAMAPLADRPSAFREFPGPHPLTLGKNSV